MQTYENKLNLLSEYLDYMKFKIDNNRMTLSEIESLVDVLKENMELIGTAEDIAHFYHKTPQDIRNIINRKVLAKPQRRVYYSFKAIQEVAPLSWHKARSGDEEQ